MKYLLLALLIACSHDAKPAAQAQDPPPLPAASGTPIGYLIDSATGLSLSDDQLTKLRAIDARLSAELDAIDKQTQHPQTSSGDGQQAQNPMGRHRGGGHRHQRAGAGSGSNAPPMVDKDAGTRASGDRTADVKAAIDEAFELFDDTQREQAHKVLSEHGVDI